MCRTSFTKFLLDLYIGICFCQLNHKQKYIVSAFLSTVMKGVAKMQNGKWNGKWNVKWKTKWNKMEKGKCNIKFIDLKGYRLDRTDFQCFKIDINVVSLRSKPLLTYNMDAPWSSLQIFAESSVNIANLCTAICTAILKEVLLFIGQHYTAHKHFKGQLLQIFKKWF